MGSSLGLPAPLIVLLALAVAMSVCMLLGFTIERVAYRPLRRAPRLAPLITAIGVSILLQTLAMMYWGRRYHTFPEIIRPERHEILGAVITDLQIADHRGVRPDHGRAAAAGALHAAGARHAGDLGEPAGGRADGRQHQQDHLRHVHHRFRAGGGGRLAGQRQLRHRPVHHGLHARPEGLHGGGARAVSAISAAPCWAACCSG